MSLLLCIAINGSTEERRFVWRTYENGIAQNAEMHSSEDSMLAAIGQQSPDRVVRVIPQHQVITHPVKLPMRAWRVRDSLLHYDVEPYLPTSLEDWHFTRLGSQKDQQATLLCIRHECIEAYHLWLSESLPKHKTGLVAQSWLLPSDGSYCLQQGQLKIYSAPNWLGWVCHEDSAEQLEHQLAEELEIGPFSDADGYGTGVLPDRLDRSRVNQWPSPRHGRYRASTGQRPAHWAAAAAAIACVFTIGLSVWVERSTQGLAEEVRQLAADNRATFRRAMPETKRIVNVVSQLRSGLAALQSKPQQLETEEPAFLPLLAHIASQLASSGSAVEVLRIQYNASDGTMIAAVSTSSMSGLQALSRSLNNDAYSTTLSKAQAGRNGGFTGQLELRREVLQ